jgi:mRNA-degrading endonuclease toxin of MazEF toxin-antitoxin module
VLQKIEPQDVWKAWVHYEEDTDKGKYRPVIVISVNDEQATIVSVPVTSTSPRDEFDIEIFDWSSIPLDHLSTARVSKVVTIPLSDFKSKFGRISNDDWETITTLYADYIDNSY